MSLELSGQVYPDTNIGYVLSDVFEEAKGQIHSEYVPNLLLKRRIEGHTCSIAPHNESVETTDNEQLNLLLFTKDESDFVTTRYISPESEYGLAILAENFDDALAIADDNLRANPNDFNALYDKAYANDALGKHEESLRLYQLCTKLDANSAVAHRSIAHSLAMLGRDEEAQASFDKAAELSGDVIDQYNLYRVHMHNQNDEKAFEFFERAVGGSPRSWEGLVFQDHIKDAMSVNPLKPEAAAKTPAANDADNFSKITCPSSIALH